MTAIDYALGGLVTQWTPATRQTLLQISLLPFQDVERLFPPLDGKSIDSELKQRLADTSCHAVVNLAKRDDVLPFMKEVAAKYGVERGVAMPEEGDEQIRSMQRLLWEAGKIAAGEDPWKGGTGEPEVPN